jgi:hypothetical protein
MKPWSLLTAAIIIAGSATCAMAEAADVFVTHAIVDMNREDPTIEDRALEAKLLAAYKHALRINSVKNCQDTPSLGGYLNQQDGHELKSVKTISVGAKSARVRVGFGPANSSNDSIFYLQQLKGVWKVYDLKGVKENDGFRSEYLTWKCESRR